MNVYKVEVEIVYNDKLIIPATYLVAANSKESANEVAKKYYNFKSVTITGCEVVKDLIYRGEEETVLFVVED